MKRKIVIIGGFLGTGKTTLLFALAKRLAGQNISVGIITNDQAPNMTDTALLRQSPANEVEEVAGSCFCCNFPGFIQAIDNLEKNGVEYVLAEPVGSCTDLSATILQPLKKYQADHDLAPLSVLIDPDRARQVFGMIPTQTDSDALYIMQKQMEEADILVVSKSDTLREVGKAELETQLTMRFPNKPVCFLSAEDGEGIDDWWQLVESWEGKRGATLLELDYDRYAHGEAVLGWLNGIVCLHWKTDRQPVRFLQTFFDELNLRLADTQREIGHVKAMLSVPNGLYMINLTKWEQMPRIRFWDSVNPPTPDLLIINARVQMPADKLEELIRDLLATTIPDQVDITIKVLQSLTPGRPNPTYRMNEIM
ncbi:MAG: GTP-binding protein [Thermoguttaceae bacterium]|nr:GTP-binding protein [Thermoguttaceae bacterium]